MKIKVRTLRKMIREALEDLSPQTKRGGVGLPAQSSDEYEPEVKTKRGMGLEPTIEDLFGDWDEHVGTDISFSSFGEKGEEEEESPRTKRSPGM